MTKNWRDSGLVGLAAMAAIAAVGTVPAQAQAEFEQGCQALQQETLEGVTVAEAGIVALDGGVSVCRIFGTRAPYLDIEVVVPETWSGQLLHQGGGGFDGTIPSALIRDEAGTATGAIPVVAERGVAYVASNGGNRSSVAAEAGPGVWASGSESGAQSADDYAYRAVGASILFAKAAVEALTGKAPDHTYFNGCSNGGRNAYIAAARWPEQYDGIVSGCETMDMSGQMAAWLNVGRVAGTPAAVSPEQYAASFAAALAACDSDDGVADSVMANPGQCSFRPADLICPETGADPLCLTADQAGTLDTIFADVSVDGETVYTRYNWADFSRYGPAFNALGGGFALLATDDPAWLSPARQAGFAVEDDYAALANGLARAGADHDRIAIATFVAQGGKLLSWHGGNDNLLSPLDHARNHAEMSALAAAQGLADPRDNARFFIVPGAGHGGGGDFTEVDWFGAISTWVEEDKAPDQLVYAFTDAKGARTLPVCEYPAYPRYDGQGDVLAAGSYACTAP